MTLREAKNKAVRVYLCRVIWGTRGNLANAAVIARITRRQMYRLVRAMGIDVKELLGDIPRDRGYKAVDAGLCSLLKKQGFNVSRTAALAGVHRSTVYRKVPVTQLLPESLRHEGSRRRGNAAWLSLGR